jgi:SNF2 family DNA or RNA helicase
MKILHGTWIPQEHQEFVQKGGFYLWVETDTKSKNKQSKLSSHPQQLTIEELAIFLANKLGLTRIYPPEITSKYFLLPTHNQQPLPSIELSRYLEQEIPEDHIELQQWEINCYPIDSIVKTLQDLHFLALYESNEWQFGSDLLFWYYYSQTFKQVIIKDQYIPAWKYRELAAPSKGKKTKTNQANNYEIYPTWEIISESYENNLQEFINYISPVCLAGRENPSDKKEFYQPETLLRHFSECLLEKIVLNTAVPATFEKKISDSPVILHCIKRPQGFNKLDLNPSNLITFNQYQQWQQWRNQLINNNEKTNFYLGFKLLEPPESSPDNWYLEFLVISKSDPSLKLTLNDYWFVNKKTKKTLQEHFGEELEKDILLNLGYAARIYPQIWLGLETDKPVGFNLTLNEAFNFLKENAWVLEDAGYKVIIPAWWTPAGRQRAKVRLKASPKKSATSSAKGGYFSLDSIIEYQYELSIGDQNISEKEWQELVNTKTPLVKFRGQWVELDPEQMQKMLEFWQNHRDEKPEISLIDLLKNNSGIDDSLDVETDEILGEMLRKLNDPTRLEIIENPPELQGTLREYQKRGVSWLQYMETLGLNGCLADDMGLGKTIQVIAKLVIDKSTNTELLPTLLIAPTSVVGNWQKEVEKFAPHLRVIIHHGANRHQKEQEFKETCTDYDLVITSFALVRKDAKLFNSLTWERVVIDEAQNIKNPKAEQTKAILKLKDKYRLALTGTPVENRLLYLWSIFNFLNPGYLGKEPQFRKTFELPIQKENNVKQATVLKNLVQPFILRRLKTDQNIIKDLPDKVEHKQYCNLTKEQASLYEAVVKDVEKQLDETEGIQRKGLILSTLLKLKQICNHPRQFLQDNSDFTAERSHKLERLGEMIEEVINEGESLLIFTQFTDIGAALQKYLKQQSHYNTYYLHGGTSRTKREQMITEFQNPETEPSAFILSLKAGGVGITLTKANHVFHFDRWWNPSVEDQATDRAFRIGQQKNVFVHKFVTLGTLEERIDQMIEDKKKLANMIVSADESWLTELDNDSFKKLIALNKQTII